MACKNEIKLTFSEVNISASNNKLVEVNIPNAIGNEDVVNRINATISKNVIASLQIGDLDNMTSKTIEESITTFNKEFQMFKTDFPESMQPWEAQIDGEIIFQSLEIISIALTSYVNTGGVHGTLNISFLNFETQTGHLIPNDKLFKDIESFKKTAKIYFDKTIEDKDIVLENTNIFKLASNIAYSDTGIVLLYNTNEIIPYPTDIIEFTIPFNEVGPLLNFDSF
ncbi:DUF4163 domain-containing protein [Flavivirga sp. Y03]|uniref:DUF4163 domain-containing protein n=2 Tax=Flavivirga algicola TaxID=2729136 RepID=A0ABX1RX97_9FLAO|nr:DUF4163 domain-containing protein [Flavivirga algicola]